MTPDDAHPLTFVTALRTPSLAALEDLADKLDLDLDVEREDDDAPEMDADPRQTSRSTLTTTMMRLRSTLC